MTAAHTHRGPSLDQLFDWAVPAQPPGASAAANDDRGDLPRNELARLDRHLATLGRASGRWRLELGELLERFTRSAGPTELGFPSSGAYGRQFAGQSPRWCDDSRAMARRLEDLPLMRAALAAGAVGWSMAEVLSRHATSETEAELLLASQGATVRAMKAQLTSAGDDIETVAPDDERSTIEATVPVDDAWAYEFVRILLDRGLGCRRADDAFEALLAEGSVALSIVDPEADAPLGPPPDLGEQWRHERREEDAAIEAELEHRLDLSPERSGVADEAPLPPMAALPSDIYVLHERIQALALSVAGRDLELGHLTRRLWAADGWRKLGFTSAAQYARERVGCSLRSLQQRMKLARGVAAVPAIEAALTGRRIGFEAAMMLVGRTRPRDTEAWIQRASERTVLGLRDDLDVATGLARLNGTAVLGPPTDEAVETYRGLRASVLSGRALAVTGSVSNQEVSFETQISGEGVPPGVGMRTIRFTMDAELARWWRRLEHRWRRASLPEAAMGASFVRFLCGAVTEAWSPTVEQAQTVKYADIYARDGYRCSSPVCNRRDVTPHHLRFRAHGGGEEPENLVALCTKCHLELLHGGCMRAGQPASETRWLLGRVPVLEVVGRRLHGIA